MPSKILCFNPTLFRKNLTRFWPLWGGASLLGALAPLSLMMYLIQSHFDFFKYSPQEMTLAYYSVVSWALPMISLIYAALCALAVWHYLYNTRSVGLYHALPITRKGLFVTNLLSGIAMMLIPYAVTGVLAALVTLVAGVFEPVGVLVTILSVLGLSLFYFASATAVIFVTGNPFAFAALYSIFHFLAALLEWLVSVLMSKFYFGVSLAYEGTLEFLSPTIFLIRKLNPHGEWQEIITLEGEHRSQLQNLRLENGFLIAVYALAGLALLGAAWLLYQRRRSESAGDVVAVGWMKPIFRYGVSLCAALCFGMVLYNILFESFQTSSTAGTVPMAVSMALAGLVGFYIASMLLAKSLKVFRANWKGALAAMLAAVVLCGTVALDPAGVESWVPAAEELESISLSIYGQYGQGIGASISDPSTVEKILDLHRAIVAEQDYLKGNRERSSSIHLGYWMGEDGFSWTEGRGEYRSRYYDLDYDAADLERSGAVRLLRELATDPVIQEANIFSNTQGLDARLTGGYVENLYNQETLAFEGLDITLEQARDLESAIRRDIQAEHFGKTLFLENASDYDAAVLKGELTLHYTVTRPLSEGGETYSSSVSLSLSVFCTETLQALKDIGILSSPYTLLTQEEYQHLRENGSLPETYAYSAYDDPFAYDCEYASCDIHSPYDAYVPAASAAVPASAVQIG